MTSFTSFRVRTPTWHKRWAILCLFALVLSMLITFSTPHRAFAVSTSSGHGSITSHSPDVFLGTACPVFAREGPYAAKLCLSVEQQTSGSVNLRGNATVYCYTGSGLVNCRDSHIKWIGAFENNVLRAIGGPSSSPAVHANAVTNYVVINVCGDLVKAVVNGAEGHFRDGVHFGNSSNHFVSIPTPFPC
jgi:hypothetical protein